MVVWFDTVNPHSVNTQLVEMLWQELAKANMVPGQPASWYLTGGMFVSPFTPSTGVNDDTKHAACQILAC
jgi:hypothetical protein